MARSRSPTRAPTSRRSRCPMGVSRDRAPAEGALADQRPQASAVHPCRGLFCLALLRRGADPAYRQRAHKNMRQNMRQQIILEDAMARDTLFSVLPPKLAEGLIGQAST